MTAVVFLGTCGESISSFCQTPLSGFPLESTNLHGSVFFEGTCLFLCLFSSKPTGKHQFCFWRLRRKSKHPCFRSKLWSRKSVDPTGKTVPSPKKEEAWRPRLVRATFVFFFFWGGGRVHSVAPRVFFCLGCRIWTPFAGVTVWGVKDLDAP